MEKPPEGQLTAAQNEAAGRSYKYVAGPKLSDDDSRLLGELGAVGVSKNWNFFNRRAELDALDEKTRQDPRFQNAAKRALIACLESGMTGDARRTMEAFRLSESELASPEAQAAMQEGFKTALADDDLQALASYVKDFKLPLSDAQMMQMKDVAKTDMIRRLKNREDLEHERKPLESLGVFQEIMATPEARSAAIEGIIGDFDDDLDKRLENFGITDADFASPEAAKAVKIGLYNALGRVSDIDDIRKMTELVKRLNPTADILKTPEIQETAQEALYRVRDGLRDAERSRAEELGWEERGDADDFDDLDFRKALQMGW